MSNYKLPEHVAIIMDGNGRWAKKRNLSRIEGHREGIKVIKNIIKHASLKPLSYLTLFAFSTDNWLRPANEVDELMRLLEIYLDTELEEAIEENIKFVTSGRLLDIPSEIRNKLITSRDKSSKNTGMVLNMALSYGGREELVDAAKAIMKDFMRKKSDIDILDEKLFCRYLYNPSVPDIDLLIRTSGEKRISNFMLWNLAYSELYFTDTLWPDYRDHDFDAAIVDYMARQRRFGMTDEQLHPEKNDA